ncbi:MAG: glycosyltransferase [Alphaproteobacteria bacterium]|nr:glycosyltransferase [Alphaproteobacteria bacterium]
MTVCLQYSRPASGSTEAEIFGMDMAINNLLRAWFRYGTQERFICRPTDNPSFDQFRALAKEAGHDPAKKCMGLDPRHPRENLIPISCLFQPDPNVADLAWQRLQVPGNGFSICGLVHTMSSERVIKVVGDLVHAPTSACDALICPSRAIRDAIHALWEIQTDYVKSRYGANFTCPVQLPVIPLGVDTTRFAKITTPEHRQNQRAALGIDDDEIVILFLGRLSFATKAHPGPLFLAAEKAAQESGKKLRLVMFGYFKPEVMDKFFRNLSNDICKTVKVDYVMNNDSRFPDGFWAGADMFISLVDNIQESFGLTPIEAMAAGLPAIVSDWDGYRDGVRNDMDGYLIPTLTPPAASGLAIAQRYFNRLDNYGEYLAASGQSTAIDIAATATAIKTLAENPGKRAQFAENGRRRAQEAYDWRYIIRAYEELWRELGKEARHEHGLGRTPEGWQAAHPAFPNPWQMFASFPTAGLDGFSVLRAITDKKQLAMLLKHEMNYFVPSLLLGKEQLAELAERFRTADGTAIADAAAGFAPADHDKVLRSCGWLLKFGICERAD